MSIEDGLPQGIPDPCPYCGEHAGVQQFIEVSNFGANPRFVPGPIECHNLKCSGPPTTHGAAWVKRGTTPEDQAVPNSYERGFKDGWNARGNQGERANG